MFVTSILIVSVAPGWMTIGSSSRASIGDLRPKSASTVRASITNESAGAPRAATAGTRNSVPRMICDESLMNLGNATRNRLRADGTPPTASVSSSGPGGGVRSEEHTSELQSHSDLVCRLLLEKKKEKKYESVITQQELNKCVM